LRSCPNRFTLALVMCLAGLLGSWWVFATKFAPGIVERAYFGHSWSVLNEIITGQATHPVEDYLAAWAGISQRVQIVLLVVSGLVIGITRPEFRRWYPANAEIPSTTGPQPICNGRLLTVNLLLAFLIGGMAYDTVTRRENWPFSPYNMYSAVERSFSFSHLRIYGIPAKEQEREILLPDAIYFRPFNKVQLYDSLLQAYSSHRPTRRARLKDMMEDVLRRYEVLRASGLHDGPPLRAMRLYELTWRVNLEDPYANQKPVDRKLILEVKADSAP
jgi:hypothetical protein